MSAEIIAALMGPIFGALSARILVPAFLAVTVLGLGTAAAQSYRPGDPALGYRPSYQARPDAEWLRESRPMRVPANVPYNGPPGASCPPRSGRAICDPCGPPSCSPAPNAFDRRTDPFAPCDEEIVFEPQFRRKHRSMPETCDGWLGCSDRWQYFCGEMGEQRSKICRDYRNYYTCRTLIDFSVALGGAAILANTTLDQKFRDWYQDDVRSSDTNNWSSFWKPFGEGAVFIPTFACLGVVGAMLPESPTASFVSDFGFRTTRGYLVGVPPMLLMQRVLGGSRPGETGHDSDWVPFADANSVSGHAFMGAVPFITLAQMSDNRLVKTGWYMCSAFTAWSRLNDDSHYLSQCILGWYMAYLACRSVDQTESFFQSDCCQISPIVTPEFAGVGAVFRR